MPVRPSQRAQGRAGRQRARAQDQSRARPAAAQACVAALLTFGLEFEGPREGLSGGSEADAAGLCRGARRP